MDYLSISDLRVKVFTAFRPEKTLHRGKLKICGLGRNQLFLEAPVSLDETLVLLQVTVYLCVNGQWKTYNIMNIYPDPDLSKDGRIDRLNFQMGENEAGNFNNDFSSLLTAECAA